MIWVQSLLWRSSDCARTVTASILDSVLPDQIFYEIKVSSASCRQGPAQVGDHGGLCLFRSE